jgi:hypothetical protein
MSSSSHIHRNHCKSPSSPSSTEICNRLKKKKGAKARLQPRIGEEKQIQLFGVITTCSLARSAASTCPHDSIHCLILSITPPDAAVSETNERSSGRYCAPEPSIAGRAPTSPPPVTGDGEAANIRLSLDDVLAYCCCSSCRMRRSFDCPSIRNCIAMESLCARGWRLWIFVRESACQRRIRLFGLIAGGKDENVGGFSNDWATAAYSVPVISTW